MEVSWKIERLDCYPVAGKRENVVRTLHWRLVGTSPAGTVATTFGSIDIEGPFSAARSPFKPFAELTEEEVVEWAKARLHVESIEAGLTSEIRRREQPVLVTPPLPWQPEYDGVTQPPL